MEFLFVSLILFSSLVSFLKLIIQANFNIPCRNFKHTKWCILMIHYKSNIVKNNAHFRHIRWNFTC